MKLLYFCKGKYRNSQQLHDIMRKGRGGSLLSRAQTPVGKVERGLATRSYNALSQRNSIMQSRANVCVSVQSKLKVWANAWLDRSINTKNYVSS